VIGTYLHGPILPANPRVADFLIAKALERRGMPADLASLPVDEVAAKAHHTARNRPR
jgi:putative adenosylcobyric acid synthase (glutamine-hydrolyzing)